MRSIKKLDRTRAERVHEAFEQLLHVFETGRNIQGLGIKQLRFGLWEVRAGLLDRIVFKRERDAVIFIAVGTHDEIRRLLKAQ